MDEKIRWEDLTDESRQLFWDASHAALHILCVTGSLEIDTVTQKAHATARGRVYYHSLKEKEDTLEGPDLMILALLRHAVQDGGILLRITKTNGGNDGRDEQAITDL